jgi:hypothetical protein
VNELNVVVVIGEKTRTVVSLFYSFTKETYPLFLVRYQLEKDKCIHQESICSDIDQNSICNTNENQCFCGPSYYSSNNTCGIYPYSIFVFCFR